MAREPAAGAGRHDATADTLQQMTLAFERLDRLVVLGEELTTLLGAVVTVAAEIIPAATSISVSTTDRGEFSTLAATDDQARKADDLQRQVGSGPCLDALSQDTIYNPQDLAHDARWPEFGRRITGELGLRSMLSYRLLAESDTLPGGDVAARSGLNTASLNVYATRPRSFDETAVMTGLLLATHTRVIIDANLAHLQVDNLDRALRTSREIGMAIGVLMAREGVTRDAAFTRLRLSSQRLNRKLRDVAAYVTDTGQLPPLRSPRQEER